jgi:hypothetical protein
VINLGPFDAAAMVFHDGDEERIVPQFRISVGEGLEGSRDVGAAAAIIADGEFFAVCGPFRTGAGVVLEIDGEGVAAKLVRHFCLDRQGWGRRLGFLDERGGRGKFAEFLRFRVGLDPKIFDGNNHVGEVLQFLFGDLFVREDFSKRLDQLFGRPGLKNFRRLLVEPLGEVPNLMGVQFAVVRQRP